VLLTARDSVPASILTRLNALTNKRVTIVGGTAAVSAAVENQLRTAGFTVTRLGGKDRFETSELVVKAGVAEGDESKVGLLASGLSPIDALAGGPLAYKGRHPIFLTAGATIPQDTIDAMVAAGTTSVIILGGTTVVPTSIETQLAARGITVVTRLGGADRSATSRLIADYLIANHGFLNTTFNVASGANGGVDALGGAALSGKENRVLLVTNTATDAGSVDDFATARAATLNAVGQHLRWSRVVRRPSRRPSRRRWRTGPWARPPPRVPS
jgi:putative cell wall-binding protein